MSGPVRERATSYPTDHAVRRAAAGLRWLSAGVSGSCLWGRCQGSAATPYQTAVLLPADLNNGEAPQSNCTCPSRQRPCKHALGLLLQWADDQLVEQAEPAFAAEWRSRLVRGPAARDRQPADPEAAARAAAQRVEQRRARVTSGLAELERWLADQVRNGLAGLPRAGYPHFDAVAARMVDAQAPGVATLLRSMPGELVGAGWPERALHQLGGLHLLVQAHARFDALPADLAITVRSRVGYPVAKADVLATRGVADTWYALGAVDTIDYQLESRRVWLRGARTGRWAVWLAFAPPGQELDVSVLPGQVLPADLHFYPGAGLRALVGQRYDWEPEALGVGGGPLGESITAVRSAFAAFLATDPWASRMPAMIRGVPVPPAERGDPWRFRDEQGRACDLVDLPGDPWPLVAQSAGRPLTLFGEWSAAGLFPLAVVGDDLGRTFSTQVCG